MVMLILEAMLEVVMLSYWDEFDLSADTGADVDLSGDAGGGGGGGCWLW